MITPFIVYHRDRDFSKSHYSLLSYLIKLTLLVFLDEQSCQGDRMTTCTNNEQPASLYFLNKRLILSGNIEFQRPN